MSGTHDHVPRAGQRHLRSLSIAFGLVVGFMIVEAVAGVVTGSLALISDAGHMATDALGLGMALAAIVAANRATTGSGRTYGLYRLEILAALANAVLLFAVAGYVIYEAVRRFQDPVDVLTTPMLVVAVAGLVVNLVGWRLLRPGAGESLNVEGAYLEVTGAPRSRRGGARRSGHRERAPGSLGGIGCRRRSRPARVDPHLRYGRCHGAPHDPRRDRSSSRPRRGPGHPSRPLLDRSRDAPS